MSDDLKRIEDKLDEVLNALPMIYAIGSILVQRQTAIDRTGINKNTLDQNKNIGKYEEVGKRKTYIEIGSVSVVKQRKKRGNSR